MSNWIRNSGFVSPAVKPASSQPNCICSLFPSAATSSSVFVSVSGMWIPSSSTSIPSATRSWGVVAVSQSFATAKSQDA